MLKIIVINVFINMTARTCRWQCPAGRVFQYRVGSGQVVDKIPGSGLGRSVEIYNRVSPGIFFTLGYFQVCRVFSGISGYVGYLRVFTGIYGYIGYHLFFGGSEQNIKV